MTDLRNEIHALGGDDFARIFQSDTLSLACQQLIQQADLKYTILSGDERDDVFLRVLKRILGRNEGMEVSGPGRQGRWESGWSESLDDFVNSRYDIAKLVPKFSGRDRIMRFDGSYIEPVSAEFEWNFVRVFRLWLFDTWLDDVDNIYEFGCGTGYNLAEMARRLPDKAYYGFDWADSSLDILRLLKEKCGLNITGGKFNMFSPDPKVRIQPSSGVFTAGALEQLGIEFNPFLDFVLNSKPDICVHWEPLVELYNDTLFDYVAAEYSKQRGYLKGFVPKLLELERDGLIKILKMGRTLGSLYHDGYSYAIWKPLG